MAVRLMVYVGSLYQSLIQSRQLLPAGHLPVVPIVLYNGGGAGLHRAMSRR
jgi:hypothetical protein